MAQDLYQIQVLLLGPREIPLDQSKALLALV